MKKSIIIDNRLKSKIESFSDWSKEGNASYSLKFKDIEDTFWFDNDTDLYNFLGKQIVERFYDKELRKGCFDYINENGETIRYNVEANRGTFTFVEDEFIGVVNK